MKKRALIIISALGVLTLIAAGVAYSWANVRQSAPVTKQEAAPSRQTPPVAARQAFSPEEADDNLDAAFLDLELTR